MSKGEGRAVSHFSEEGVLVHTCWAEGQGHCGKRIMSELEVFGQCLVSVPSLWETEAQRQPKVTL